MPHYDVIVVGAGIFGSTAAYHAQKLGMRTLLLEQFKLGHTKGSSHGKSRIIRYAHKDAPYLPMVKDAYEQIAELEKKRGEKLWRKTGLLWAQKAEAIEKISAILKDFGAEHEVVPGDQISNRYPHFKFGNDISGLIDPMGGVLYADRWMNAFQDEFKKLGGVIQDDEEMKSFTDDQPVKVQTTTSNYTANKLIITVGSWIQKVIPTLPLKIQPESMSVCYWKPKEKAEEKLAESMPVFICKQIPGHVDVFAMPSVDYEGAVKLCADDGHPIAAGEDHPSQLPEKYVSLPQKFVGTIMPKFDSEPTLVEHCKYTMAEDSRYVLDMMPGSKNVVVGACGSGSGFKVSPCVGRVLAEMAAGKKTSVDVSYFSLDRFSK